MRKLMVAITISLMAAAGIAAADETDEYIDLLRSDLQADKRLIVEYSMELTDEEATKFWPIYDKYEVERIALGDKLLDLIKRFPEAVGVTGPETVGDLSTEWWKLQDEELKLKKKYYAKAEKEIRPRIAARWMQIEHRLSMLIDLQLAAETPLIEPVPR